MHQYILFFKPFGVLCQFTDEEGRPTLKDFIPIPGVYSVGRLDFDSEGLLLLTDDGPLNHTLADPHFEHTKRYLVQVEGVVTDEAILRLTKGVFIKGYQTLPAKIRLVEAPEIPPREKAITPHGPTAWLEMVLHEGKKRQIRHMTAAVGLPTLRLVRVSIGPIQLGTMKPGGWRALTQSEILQLRRLVRRRPFLSSPSGGG